jgi:hypothetical protein
MCWELSRSPIVLAPKYTVLLQALYPGDFEGRYRIAATDPKPIPIRRAISSG